MNTFTSGLIIIAGHYGVGKTNLALNMARRIAQEKRPVTLIDLDVVNPYFRSSDYLSLLEASGVQVIAPLFARTTLENPSLPPAVDGAIDSGDTVIVDVGGDDDGALTLGRYRSVIQARKERDEDYAFWYVINRFRSNAPTIEIAAEEALAFLREIETACGLKATGVINNSHLQAETNLATLQEGLAFSEVVVRMLDALPLIATTVPAALLSEAQLDPALGDQTRAGNLWPVKTLVTTPWQL